MLVTLLVISIGEALFMVMHNRLFICTPSVDTKADNNTVYILSIVGRTDPLPHGLWHFWTSHNDPNVFQCFPEHRWTPLPTLQNSTEALSPDNIPSMCTGITFLHWSRHILWLCSDYLVIVVIILFYPSLANSTCIGWLYNQTIKARVVIGHVYWHTWRM